MNLGLVVNIVDAVFWILELLIFVRVMISWFPVSPFNPWIRRLRRIVDPILSPFRRVLPGFSGVDFSPLLALAALYVLQRVIDSLLVVGHVSLSLALLSVARQVVLGIIVFFCVVVFVRLLFSFFHADPWHPLVLTVRQFTNPIVRPFAGVVPRNAAIDAGAAAAFIAFLVLFFAARFLFDALGAF